MATCEICNEEAVVSSHIVVNGRIYLNEDDVCRRCGFNDRELLQWVREHQPGELEALKRDLGYEHVPEPADGIIASRHFPDDE